MKKIVISFFFLNYFLVSISFAQFSARRTISSGSNDPSKKSKEKPFVTIDIGASSGVYNSNSYTEANLGVNLNFTDWLTWRNAGFKRFSSAGDKDLTGVDSTFRFNITAPFDGGAFRFFVGPGYRWVESSDKNAALAEAGLGLNVGRVGVSGGAKYLKYDKVQTNSRTGLETSREDLHYFLTFSGGAGMSF